MKNEFESKTLLLPSFFLLSTGLGHWLQRCHYVIMLKRQCNDRRALFHYFCRGGRRTKVTVRREVVWNAEKIRASVNKPNSSAAANSAHHHCLCTHRLRCCVYLLYCNVIDVVASRRDQLAFQNEVKFSV